MNNTTSPLHNKTTPFHKLNQQYTDLQQHWDSIKQSKSRIRSSVGSGIGAFRLLENSPKELMSSIQNVKSPNSDGETIWKVRTNDLAMEEIIRERRLAIKSGKLEGRRLFQDDDDDDDDVVEEEEDGRCEVEICTSCWVNLIRNQDEVVTSPPLSFSNDEIECVSRESLSQPECSSTSSLCYHKLVAEEEEDKVTIVEEKDVEEKDVEEKEDVGGCCVHKGWNFTMIWLVVALIICALGINIMQGLGSCFGEPILVPT